MVWRRKGSSREGAVDMYFGAEQPQWLSSIEYTHSSCSAPCQQPLYFANEIKQNLFFFKSFSLPSLSTLSTTIVTEKSKKNPKNKIVIYIEEKLQKYILILKSSYKATLNVLISSEFSGISLQVIWSNIALLRLWYLNEKRTGEKNHGE